MQSNKKNSYVALWYEPEASGYEFRWGEWFLSIHLILLVALGVFSVSNRNEYQRQNK
jgi:hypothetical protein